VYSIAVKKVENRYSNVFITRKIFFYGVITILPLLWINRHEMSSPASLIENTAIVGNVLFLGVLASLICFILWNIVLRHLGVVASTNYLFLNPVVTLVASFIFLDEKITSMSIIGSIAVLAGVIIATKNSTD
jgi:drug/metabolite transporter (DMT)-like permease